LRGNSSAAGFCPAAALVLILILAAAVLGGSIAAQAQQDRRLPEKRLPRELRDEGFVVKVTPLLAEPVMGFLIGRGFPAPIAQRYAARCVIRVVMSNESAHARISYDLRSWRTRRPDGALGVPRTREDWMKEWQGSPLSNASRMGFEWSQLPTMLELDNGDSTQGMVNTGLPAGSRFDLLLEWVIAGTTYRNHVEGIDCAPPS
jgi:hypothetical protein